MTYSIFNDVDTGYTFDDFLLVPSLSEIKSRQDIDISNELVSGMKFDIPIISSNMCKITEEDMVNVMCSIGATAAFHRFMPAHDLVQNHIARVESEHDRKFGISVGVDLQYIKNVFIQKERYGELIKVQIGYVIIDVAHGHHSKVADTIKYLKDNYEFPVIAGNVATIEGTEYLVAAGADAIKIGIGPGSVCTTRVVTGFGYPQLSAISECAQIKETNDVRIIADGGIRYSSDIVKALAAGADFVMLGGLLAGSKETPGQVLSHGESSENKVKVYGGMASLDAQISCLGKGKDNIVPEGVSTIVKYKGTVIDIIQNLSGAIRHGLSYAGCKDIKELQEYATQPEAWVQATSAGQVE